MKSVVEVFHPPPSRFRIVDAFLVVAIFVGISLIDLVVLAFYILVSYVSLVSSVAFSVVVVAAAAASPLFATPVVVVHVFSGVELPVVEEMVRLSPPFPSSSPPRQSWGVFSFFVTVGIVAAVAVGCVCFATLFAGHVFDMRREATHVQQKRLRPSTTTSTCLSGHISTLGIVQKLCWVRVTCRTISPVPILD